MLLRTAYPHRISWLTIIGVLPLFFVSADSKGLSKSTSSLESTLAGPHGSVDSKDSYRPEIWSVWKAGTVLFMWDRRALNFMRGRRADFFVGGRRTDFFLGGRKTANGAFRGHGSLQKRKT